MLSFHCPQGKSPHLHASEFSSNRIFYNITGPFSNWHKFKKPFSGSQPWSCDFFLDSGSGEYVLPSEDMPVEQEDFITKDVIRSAIKEMKKGKSPRDDEIQWIL